MSDTTDRVVKKVGDFLDQAEPVPGAGRLKGFADVADLSEDDRIDVIGRTAIEKNQVVGCVVDAAPAAKADRYIDKLRAKFPTLQILHRGPGPTPGTTLIKVGPPGAT